MKTESWDDMNLRSMRSSCGKTQQQLAVDLQTTQAQLSRMEARDDHLVSTLRAYVEALGGELAVVATFGDKSVRLHGV